MIRRYQYTDSESDRYQISRYPVIPTSDADLFIISRQGDRLDLLAQQFYGDVRAWWILAEANQIGKGTLVVAPGIQLRIPDRTLFYMALLEQAEAEK